MALTQISTKGIKDGTITNVDVGASAAIAGSKLNPVGLSNVGIGTTSPDSILDLSGSAPRITFNDTAGTDDIAKIFSTSGSLYFQQRDGTSHGQIIFRTENNSSASERMRIDSSGRLLLGATSAVGNGTKIEARDDSNSAQGRIMANGFVARDNYGSATNITNGMYSPSTDNLAFATDSTERVKINGFGKIFQFANGGENQFVSQRTGSAGSNGDFYFHLFAQNNGGTSVGGIGIVRDTANDDARIVFSTASGGTNAERMRIDSSGKVGIGTSSPVNPLHVVLDSQDIATFESTSASNSGAQIAFKHSSASPADNDTIANLTFDGRDDSNNATTYAQLRVLATDVSNNSESGAYQFFTRDAGSFDERMRIQGDGMIGMGTTGPKAGLHVATENATYGKSAVFGANGFIDSANYHYTDATISLLGQDADGNNKGAGVEFTARNSANSNWSHGSIVMERDGDFSFFTGGSGNYVGVEKMRIKTGGNVFIGDSVNSSGLVNSRGYIFETSGTMQIKVSTTADKNVLEIGNPNGNVGRIQAHANSTSYLGSSDYRLKENAVAISDGITRLKTLKPYRFNWKSDPNTTVDGFFAHEVTAVPEAISGTKDEVALEDNEIKKIKKGDPIYQMIDHSKLVPLLVAGLQEAIAKVEILETEVAALKAS